MFNYKSLLAITLVALASLASAAPASVQNGAADDSASVQVCTNGVRSLRRSDGGLSFLNEEISAAIIPDGFVCTFFDDFGCISEGTGNSGTDTEVVLQEGSYDFFDVEGLSGPEDFNDLTSSFSCSPVPLQGFPTSEGMEIWE
ncbi:hypothetical protein B0H11DRAFT_2359155 [Mycena galericulata]|nr:hypothetical protein B0H11DRAFT_2359155 [Mycena galericulata]